MPSLQNAASKITTSSEPNWNPGVGHQFGGTMSYPGPSGEKQTLTVENTRDGSSLKHQSDYKDDMNKP